MSDEPPLLPWYADPFVWVIVGVLLFLIGAVWSVSYWLVPG